MSERTAALGIKAPPKTITHNGTTYTVAPVLTHGTLAAVEAKLYERAKEALKASRELYSAEEYRAEADALRKKYEEGFYAFEGEHALAYLQTLPGAVLVLSCMMTADPAQILTLLVERTEEMEQFLNEALGDSFPKAKPLALKRGAKKVKPKRRGK